MSNKLEEARRLINETDAQMAKLFEQRMRAAKEVYAYKKEMGLPIFDPKREAEVIERNAALIADPTLRAYYVDYQKHLMEVSKAYQYALQDRGAEQDDADGGVAPAESASESPAK